MSDSDLKAFGDEVTTFLVGHAPPRQAEEKFVWGEGPDRVSIFDEKSIETELAQLGEAKAWRAARADAGLGYIAGPKQYGGRELTPAHERLYNTLEARYETPNQSFFGIGLGMVAPTILAHGSDRAKELYLQGMYSGDIVGCQLFSEPEAGSDLASVQARAERDGDEWRITGQKVWTSGAHYSDIGEVLCRTDPTLPKHRGLTAFVVDMKAPGSTSVPCAR